MINNFEKGALKAAHVGVSIVNDPAFERRIEGNKKEKGGKGSTAKDRMVIVEISRSSYGH